MGLVEEFNIPMTKLSRFLARVRSKYRHNPYHNWYHGFMVMHFVYLTIISSPAVQRCLLPVHVLGALVAALCHDIDHPGNNNAFEISAMTQLALRHNDRSVLENHHAYTTFELLRF